MSFGLRGLTDIQRTALIQELWQIQNGKCFISEKLINLTLQSSDLDIDHVIPTRDGGKDDKSNWALTFSHYNRSKQANNLRIARVLARFEDLKITVSDARGINLGHVLDSKNGGKYPLISSIDKGNDTLEYSLSKVGLTEVQSMPIMHDVLSGLDHGFAELPIEYLFHDDRLNPRGIGSNIRGLVIEFFSKFPQLHVPLAWIDTAEEGGPKVRIFDGQHKAAAQILLGVRRLPVRIFINPDPDLLLTANTHAGTTLRQVAFDKATQRHLGASILLDRIERFRDDRKLSPDYSSFTEQQLVDHFKGEQAQMRRYVIDAKRNAITYHPENKLRDFIEMGGKGTERPLSYSAIEKAIFSQAICGEMLDTPDDHGVDLGQNPRDLEKDQIVRLLNIIAEVLYIGTWNPKIGSAKLESKVQKDQDIPENHLRAYRMGREEILQAWFELVLQVCQTIVVSNGKIWDKDRPFHKRLPENLWNKVEQFIRNFANLPMWKNRSLSSTVFGGKQNQNFWRQAFQTGSANGIAILPSGGINLIDLMED